MCERMKVPVPRAASSPSESISRALRDRNTAAKLRGARSRDAIFALLSATETLHAA